MTYDPTTWVDDGPPCIDDTNLNNMEAGIDRAQGDVMVLRGLTAARPASDPLLIGRRYFATDAPYEISRDNGAGWDVVGYTNNAYTALGDIQVGTAANAAAPLGIGAGGEVLTVAAGTASWAAAAAGGALTLIQEQVLGAPVAAVTFAAIPGTYRSLALIYHARTDRAAQVGDGLWWRANADAGNNYDHLLTRTWFGAVQGTGAVAQVGGYISEIEAALARANCFTAGFVYWPGYALADREKHSIAPYANRIGVGALVGDFRKTTANAHWRNVAAITNLLLFPGAGPNFITGCIFQLYGIT